LENGNLQQNLDLIPEKIRIAKLAEKFTSSYDKVSTIQYKNERDSINTLLTAKESLASELKISDTEHASFFNAL
jgi:hypothetical protein